MYSNCASSNPFTDYSVQQMTNTYIGVDINVWSQACQGIHIDIMVTELWGGRPSSCTSCGGGSWS